jgi:hypothetical protein
MQPYKIPANTHTKNIPRKKKHQKTPHRTQNHPQQPLHPPNNQQIEPPNKKTTLLETTTKNGTYKPKQPKKREQPTTTYYKYTNNQLYQTLIKDIKKTSQTQQNTKTN